MREIGGDENLREFLYLATTRCNCRCKHCSPSVYTGKPNELTSKKLIERFEESSFLQRNSVNVAGGEPFLKEDIDEFVLYLDGKEIPCIITTNGWFTDKIVNLMNRLKDTNTVRFSISIDGIGQVHDGIRGLNGIYERALETVKLVKERGFGVQVNMVAQKSNIKQISEMKKIFGELQIPINIIPKVSVNNEPFEYTEDQIRELYPDVFLPREKKFLLSKGEYVIKKNCHAGMNSYILDSNGDVYTCQGGFYSDDHAKYLMGNLWEQPFDEIFLSERAERVYEEVVKSCKGCALPCDIEREVTEFGYSTEFTLEDVSVFRDRISSMCYMEDINCDNYNWHNLEQDENGSFRWMRGNSASVFLKAPSKFSCLTIDSLNLQECNTNGESLWLSCEIDGSEIGKSDISVGEQHIEIPLDNIKLVTDELCKITLRTNLSWTPKEVYGSDDTRLLGIGIRSVTIN